MRRSRTSLELATWDEVYPTGIYALRANVGETSSINGDERHTVQAQHHPGESQTGFWRTFGEVVIRPRQALADLEHDSHALRKGVGALLLVLVVYTVILGIFVANDYPAAAPAALPFSVDELYRAEIWYMGPLFFYATLATAGVLLLTTHILGEPAEHSLAFTRIAFASTVPFALTVMVVEGVIALLVLFNFAQPETILDWLRGDGIPFAITYQTISGVWLAALFVIVAQQMTGRGWPLSTLVGLTAVVVYAIPIGLFIR